MNRINLNPESQDAHCIERVYNPKPHAPAVVAGFMSGSGTNIVKVLESERSLEQTLGEDAPFRMRVIVTDNYSSNADKIAKEWKRELVIFDISDFHREMKVKKTLKTEEGRKAREEYTKILGMILKPYQVDFGVFGGFEPLTNIMEEFPCLNVHPGDLTYMKNGQRHLVGLHTVPVERALDEGLDYLRSSVILATPYKGAGENMDDGPILGIGPKLEIGNEKNPKTLQSMLKEKSDWVILPRIVLEVALGNIMIDVNANTALYKGVPGFITLDNDSEKKINGIAGYKSLKEE